MDQNRGLGLSFASWMVLGKLAAQDKRMSLNLRGGTMEDGTVVVELLDCSAAIKHVATLAIRAMLVTGTPEEAIGLLEHMTRNDDPPPDNPNIIDGYMLAAQSIREVVANGDE